MAICASIRGTWQSGSIGHLSHPGTLINVQGEGGFHPSALSQRHTRPAPAELLTSQGCPAPGEAISMAIKEARRNQRKSAIDKAITRACGWAGARMVAGKSARHSRDKATQGGTGSKEVCGTCARGQVLGMPQAGQQQGPARRSVSSRAQSTGPRRGARHSGQSRAVPSTLPVGRPEKLTWAGARLPGFTLLPTAAYARQNQQGNPSTQSSIRQTQTLKGKSVDRRVQARRHSLIPCPSPPPVPLQHAGC